MLSQVAATAVRALGGRVTRVYAYRVGGTASELAAPLGGLTACYPEKAPPLRAETAPRSRRPGPAAWPVPRVRGRSAEFFRSL